MNSPTKAVVTSICHAGMNFEGLMLPDGTYAIALAQANELLGFSDSPNNYLKVCKRILSKGFGFSKTLENGKLATELNNSPMWVLSLEEFSMLCLVLMQEGNTRANKIVFASVTEKLERVFDSAFGNVVEEREREQRFAARLLTKADFRPLTDELKRHGFTEGWQYGKYVSSFQSIIGFEDGTRDELPIQTLLVLERCQAELRILMKSGLKPYDALEFWSKNQR